MSLAIREMKMKTAVRHCFSYIRIDKIQKIKNLSPLVNGIEIYPSILAWRIPWREELGQLQSMGLQRVGHNLVTFTFTLVASGTYRN